MALRDLFGRRQAASVRATPGGGGAAEIAAARARVAAAPTDPAAHHALGRAFAAAGSWDQAVAELRTASALGGSEPALADDLARATASVPQRGTAPLVGMDHNAYVRTRALAVHLAAAFAPRADFSVLDVGGGKGRLAQFLPAARYVLAEPSVNGVSSAALPFAEKSFDAVVSCHVLEHVAPDDRPAFLDRLCRTARSRVVLLNPFRDDRVPEDERLRLVIELTGAAWAKEHLDCSLPRVEDVTSFAAARGWTTHVEPNGCLATSLALSLLNHYALEQGRGADLVRISEHFNTRLLAAATNPEYPSGRLVEIRVGD